jgi:predicted DNA-binding antitoxin AbrB/MazE fold protein
MTVKAIFENGVFRPTQPVHLPEQAEVDVLLPENGPADEQLDRIYQILGETYTSGQTDTAERHNEHQP